MPGISDQIEEMRRKRRSQLDKILSTPSPQAGPLNFQPVPLPQSHGSVIVGAVPVLGALSGGAHAAANAPSMPISLPTAATAAQSTFEPLTASGKPTSPARGSPGAPPLSPRGAQAPPTLLQRAGTFAKGAVQNNDLYRTIAALFL